MKKNAPFFLAGADRSGIGLLGELFEAHPQIAVTRRINFWSFYYNRYGYLGDQRNLDRCLAEMVSYTRIRRLQPDVERLRQDFLNGDSTYKRLFTLLQEQNMRRLGKTWWADKSLNSERYANLILSTYPTAKMIHIIRDPRDSFASRLNHPSRGQIRVATGAAIWLWSARLAESNRRKHPDRYRIIRYESLVEKPEACLRELCDFLGVEFSPEMLMIEQRVGDASEAGIQEVERVPRQIWNTSVGRYRNALSAREITFLQQVGKNKMDLFDYALDPPGLSWPSMLLFYLVDYPSKVALMMLWYAKERMQMRLGKAPADRRLKPNQDIVGIDGSWSLNS